MPLKITTTQFIETHFTPTYHYFHCRITHLTFSSSSLIDDKTHLLLSLWLTIAQQVSVSFDKVFMLSSG